MNIDPSWKSRLNIRALSLPALLRIAALLILLTCAQSSRAELLTLNMPASGTWEASYNDSPPPGSTTYSNNSGPDGNAGFESLPFGSLSWKNYYILDLSDFSSADPISSVTFNMNAGPNDGYVAQYELTLTDLSPSVLESSDTTDAVSIFNELGSGMLLASGTGVPYTPTGGFIFTLDGNSNFIDFLNDNLGGEVAIAGVISEGHNYVLSSPTFTVTTVPEPAPGLLLCLGAAGLFLIRRRLRARHRPPAS